MTKLIARLTSSPREILQIRSAALSSLLGSDAVPGYGLDCRKAKPTSPFMVNGSHQTL